MGEVTVADGKETDTNNVGDLSDGSCTRTHDADRRKARREKKLITT